jgi:protein N-terminal amidase
MRIACLQFAPQLGKVKENVARADALLSISSPQSLDILVLPELAFTGILSIFYAP